MPEKSLHEIPRAWRELYEKGKAALTRNNLDYAVDIFNQILQKEPAFYDCREALRATQFKKAGAGGGFFKKMIGTASSSPQIAKGQFVLRNNPLEAIVIAEQILNGDPNNGMAHKLLADAALAADLPKTAVLSLEIALKGSPRDKDLALKLGEALAAQGNITRAETIYGELQRANPHDPSIAQALKNLSASRTMSEGGYEGLEDGKGSYRDILANKNQAVSLEQENRHVKSEDVSARLIAENEQRILTEPDNLKLLRSTAELYAQKNQFDKALEYYQRIINTSEIIDPSLEKLITETTVRKYDYLASQLIPESENYTVDLARLQSEKQDFLLADAKRRVDRYPNDLQARYDLGLMYFQAGKLNEAIQELQKAQTNPQKRIQALALLGRCFEKKGINDMAARSYQTALKEKQLFDDEKKELIYSLGCVLEKMGKPDEAIEYLKQIYEIDIGYKDVSSKVDAYYAGK
jgi:tetratricopeptide (TPR) repeat protein